MANKPFKFVHIPHEISEPIEELQQEQPEGREVECLLDRLKEHFRQGQKGEVSETVKEQQRQAFLSQIPEEARKNVTKDLLDTATGLQLVESIPLLPNTMKNGFVAVNMYVDDKGSIRGLPLNRRASEIASCCGHPVEVRGDAFLARIMDNEENFERYDFTIEEMSSGAKWVKDAKKYHDEKARQEPVEDIFARVRSNSAAGAKIVELTPAEEEKEKGNVSFKAGKYQDAIRHYTQAIVHDPDMVVAFNNRAMAYLKGEMFVEAEADASKALDLDSKNVKAIFRRGVARESQGKIADAIADYQTVVKMEPGNLLAKKKIASLEGK